MAGRHACVLAATSTFVLDGLSPENFARVGVLPRHLPSETFREVAIQLLGEAQNTACMEGHPPALWLVCRDEH